MTNFCELSFEAVAQLAKVNTPCIERFTIDQYREERRIVMSVGNSANSPGGFMRKSKRENRSILAWMLRSCFSAVLTFALTLAGAVIGAFLEWFVRNQ